MVMSRRPIEDLLREATDDLFTVDVADTPVALAKAWRGFCVTGAAGQLLAATAESEDYPVLWENAQPVLYAAVAALKDAPSLPDGLTTELNPAGRPGDRLGDDAATGIKEQILATALALNTVLPRAATVASDQHDSAALRVATTMAHELANCYEARWGTERDRATRIPIWFEIDPT